MCSQPGSALLAEVLNVFLGEVTACCARLVRARGLKEAKTGAYTVIQMFSGSLALNIHIHSLLLDGVFVPGGAEPTPVFRPPAVKEADVLGRDTEDYEPLPARAPPQLDIVL